MPPVPYTWGPMELVEAPISPTQAVLDSIRRIVRDLRLSARAAGVAPGVTPAQLFVLHCLEAAPAGSIAELAQRTFTDASSVSVALSRLVDAGLVRRRRSTSDGRRAEIALTAKGRALLKVAPEPAQARLVAALDRMPPRVVAALSRALQTLVSEMGSADIEPRMFLEEERAPRSRPRG